MNTIYFWLCSILYAAYTSYHLKAFLREHDIHIVAEMPDFSFSTEIDFDNLSSIQNNLISIFWEETSNNDEWDEEKYGLINFEWKIERRNIRNFELISCLLYTSDAADE